MLNKKATEMTTQLNKQFIQLLDELYIDADDYDMICFLLGDAQ